MTPHLIGGTGPVGSAIARQLVSAGQTVLVASRSGAGLPIAGADRVAVDASDAAARSRFGFEPTPWSDAWIETVTEVLSGTSKSVTNTGRHPSDDLRRMS